MENLLPSGGTLEDLTEAAMNIPSCSWASIQQNKDIINRWAALGWHKNDIKCLRKTVMVMDAEEQTLCIYGSVYHVEDLVEKPTTWVATVIHPNEVSQLRS
jgi:hypothetical protein